MGRIETKRELILNLRRNQKLVVYDSQRGNEQRSLLPWKKALLDSAGHLWLQLLSC